MRCLIVGAGEAGQAIARDLHRMPEYGLVPVGFLDDSPDEATAEGQLILGGTGDLSAAVLEYGVEAVIIAIPSLPSSEIRRLAQAASAAGATVRYLPSFIAALERDAHLSDLRRLRIDRLLGRAELRVISTASRSVVAGRRVLVTGAGGSIGSELCRQIKGFGPAALCLLDHDESNLHRLQMQLTGEALLDSDDVIIADIRDKRRVRQVFCDLLPDVVFHAAAHKHLPLLERHPCEGVKSNVLGTEHLVEAAVDVGVERFILISTDKAADPNSVLGATKRLAELIVRAKAGGRTKVASVRFGNVLGSRGSVLSVISEQIGNGEPVTVTHPDVTRYFMTVEEAVGLVLEAAAMADQGKVFVLDMGEPVRIIDLVHRFADEMHLDQDSVTIRYTGLRAGEKLTETLSSVYEQLLPTDHPKISAIAPPELRRDLVVRLDELYYAAATNRSREVRRLLADILPEYTPSRPEPLATAMAAPYPDDF
jgi:FlaA1/EpsC-like NDP-sugar epimerase